jgi:PAS domain S-box-containing protein
MAEIPPPHGAPAVPPGFTPKLLDTVPALVVVIDGAGRIVLFNRACERVTGYRFEEVRGRTAWELIPHAEVERVRAAMDGLLASGSPVHVENHWVAKDGSRRLIAWTDSVIAGDGPDRWIIGTGVDVTAERRAEALLSQSEAQLQALFERAPVGIARIDPQGHAVRVNDRLSKLLGYTREELERLGVADVTHPADLEANLELLARAGRGELDCYAMEKRYVRKDGGIVWADLTVSCVRDVDGEVEFFIAVIDDISERKAAEEALRQGERAARRHAAELQTILDTVPAAIFITRDRESRVMEGNRFCAEVLRMPSGQNVSLSAPPGDRPAHFRAMKGGVEIRADQLPVQVAARHGFEVRDGELDLAFDDGTVRHLVGNASPLRHGSGESCGAVGAFVDITDRKRMEDELRASRAELRAFAARLDSVREEEQARIARDLHDDMGQMLTAVKMDLRWIEQRLERAREVPTGDLLEHAVDASELVDRAIASVRKLAGTLRPGVLDRLGLQAALGQEVRRFRQRTRAGCTFVVDDDFPDVGGEVATALYRIGLEALTNVARHAHARKVVLTLRARDGAVILSVEDDGCGIGAGPRDRTPLGIVGMRERASRVGGELRVAPRAGGGTTVTAIVPLDGRTSSGA